MKTFHEKHHDWMHSMLHRQQYLIKITCNRCAYSDAISYAKSVLKIAGELLELASQEPKE